MKATGIDLAGVESRPTGFCIMDDSLCSSSCLLYTDNEILDKTLKCASDVVAIDAPLALPRGRESLTKRSNIHLRGCDRELLRMGIKFFPLTLGPMRQLTERGMRLRAELQKKGLVVIETYPGAVQDILHIPRKGKGLEKLAKGLGLAGIRGLDTGLTGDELDAVTCALVGVLYLRGKYRAIGDPGEMLTILPGVGWIRRTPKSGKIERRRCHIERDTARKIHQGVSGRSRQAGGGGEDFLS